MTLFYEKIKDPLFYIGIFLLFFWGLDSYYKIIIQHSPSLLLWWSAAGLGITAVALLSRNTLLITGMFCAMTVNESLWMISFLSNLAIHKDVLEVATYMFQYDYPFLLYIVGLFHLFVVPGILCALVLTRKVSKRGWLAAYIFGLIVALGIYFFPDSRENVNCIRPQYQGCQAFFGFLHDALYNKFQFSNFIGIVIAATLHAIFVFIPLNFLLIIAAKKLHWKIEK